MCLIFIEENSNESGKCAVVNTLNGCTRKSGDDSDGSLPRADSALSNESTTSSQVNTLFVELLKGFLVVDVSATGRASWIIVLRSDWDWRGQH